MIEKQDVWGGGYCLVLGHSRFFIYIFVVVLLLSKPAVIFTLFNFNINDSRPQLMNIYGR